MKTALNKKGLTFIEVIISLGILGIISIAFLSLFTNGISGVFSAGFKSKGEYKAQQVIENEIRDISDADYSTGSVSVDITDEADFIISFPSVRDIELSGHIVDVRYDDGKQKAALLTFLPD